ncbi:MAG: hypothetical protein ACI92S_000217 [Planctomycetaceae bacterium]|jgi:hypothetical protein
MQSPEHMRPSAIQDLQTALRYLPDQTVGLSARRSPTMRSVPWLKNSTKPRRRFAGSNRGSTQLPRVWNVRRPVNARELKLQRDRIVISTNGVDRRTCQTVSTIGEERSIQLCCRIEPRHDRSAKLKQDNQVDQFEPDEPRRLSPRFSEVGNRKRQKRERVDNF